MAQRFGGKHSPGKGREQRVPTEIESVEAAGARAWLMFVPAIVLVFTSLGSGPVILSVALAGAAVLTLAAWLLREGLKAEAAYEARKVARRPAFPRKIVSSLLTGVGVALAAWTSSQEITGPLLYGVIAGALHSAAFGIDPLRSKNMEGVDTFQQDRVARVVEEAEAHLSAMHAAITRTGDRALEGRVAAFAQTAREMFRTVEEDPRDLTGARKYMGVYLQGARDATVKFVDIYARDRDAEAKADYLALLDDLERNFEAQTTKMLSNERTDMDIEIKVLRDRLQRDGIAASHRERTSE